MKLVLKGALFDVIMKRLLGLIMMIALLSQPLVKSEIDSYVSHPGNIPDFHNFSTPQLEPGQNGDFSLDVLNRYNETLENVVIEAEVYHRADIDESETLADIPSKERPYISNTKWVSNLDEMETTQDASDTKKATFDVGDLESNETITLEFRIETKEETKEGTYFVRFSMSFMHNDTERQMQSRGHWSMELWENATTNVPEASPGNINLDVLGVDGIIPDSSFGVKKPIPKWPLYLLITLTIVFAGLSVIFYLEEEGNYPELNKWLQKQRGKLNELRLRFKYRKSS
ncbi:MAG: hypothetical protein CXT75_11565 [Methanobacteriota archaeon]|nr:MAG: hypothetical protein CXT75_11565 [Euryarchaeota archaeon]